MENINRNYKKIHTAILDQKSMLTGMKTSLEGFNSSFAGDSVNLPKDIEVLKSKVHKRKKNEQSEQSIRESWDPSS